MGGVVNIVTRQMTTDGVRTHLRGGYGSWNTLETELTNVCARAVSAAWRAPHTTALMATGPVCLLSK